MSRTETGRPIPVTPPAVVNGAVIPDSSRVFSKTSRGPTETAGNHHASCEVAATCTCFLVRLSHQIRTHLGSIVSAAEMVPEAHLTEAQKEFIETTTQSARALAAMTDEVADFARCLAVGAGSLTYQTESIESPSADETVDLNGAGLSRDEPIGSVQGEQAMLSKTPIGANRAFNQGNFRTRIPPDTAKLIRILVAEDHLMNQQVMLRMLSRLGFHADAVCNGAEAVAALHRSPYDIVLMDCQMPELDGYEATRQIRSSGGRFRSTPIIAVTANAMIGDREKCLASGMSDYMSKPVLAQTLATTLEKWILPDAASGASPPEKSPPRASSHATSSESSESAPQQASVSGTSTSTADDGGEVIDPGAIETLRGIDSGDEGFMTKIIELFLADLSDRVAALIVAAEKRDGAALKSVAHALKGSCGHFGAVRLAKLCRTVEQIGREESTDDPREAVGRLEAEAGRVRSALQQIERDSRENSAKTEEPD